MKQFPAEQMRQSCGILTGDLPAGCDESGWEEEEEEGVGHARDMGRLP